MCVCLKLTANNHHFSSIQVILKLESEAELIESNLFFHCIIVKLGSCIPDPEFEDQFLIEMTAIPYYN